jgi:hypothetical protein
MVSSNTTEHVVSIPQTKVNTTSPMRTNPSTGNLVGPSLNISFSFQ